MTLNNISIKSKVLFIVLIPILALVVVSGMKALNLNKTAKYQSDIVELMKVSIAANNLVHELQKERGASAGYTNSRGQKFSDTLIKQRQLTDSKLQILLDTIQSVDLTQFDDNYNTHLDKALDQLKPLSTTRKKVSSLSIPLSEVVGYYTESNKQLLHVTKQTIYIAKDPKMLRDISAYLYFMQSKERAGIERAVGAAGFSGSWSSTLKTKLKDLIGIQNTYMDVFLAFATEKERAFYAEKMSDPAIKEVERMRKIALGEQSQFSNITGEYWFETITQKINQLKAVEDFVANDVIELAQEEAQNAQNELFVFTGVLLGLITFIAILTLLIVRDLLGNIQNTQNVMAELAAGNVNVDVEGTERKDEIGLMAQSILSFKDGLIEKENLERQALATQTKAEEEKRKAMEDLAVEFDEKIGGFITTLSSSTSELESSAEGMLGIAEETSKASQSVVSSTEGASSNVSTVAAAMEEMSASSAEISTQINNTRDRSSEMSVNASEANSKITALNELVSNIGEVVGSIRDIAEQTNLLALNATIEAARAGDAGKGFAVVADEVKKLASETEAKTTEIEDRIHSIQSATNSSVSAMELIIENISNIDEAVVVVASAVEEQNATNIEISRSISEASQSVQNVVQSITEVQQGANETGNSANNVLNSSQQMAQLSNDLKVAIDQFLDKISGQE